MVIGMPQLTNQYYLEKSRKLSMKNPMIFQEISKLEYLKTNMVTFNCLIFQEYLKALLWRFLEGKMLRKKDFEKERLQGEKTRFIVLKFLKKSRVQDLDRIAPILNLAILLYGTFLLEPEQKLMKTNTT